MSGLIVPAAFMRSSDRKLQESALRKLKMRLNCPPIGARTNLLNFEVDGQAPDVTGSQNFIVNASLSDGTIVSTNTFGGDPTFIIGFVAITRALAKGVWRFRIDISASAGSANDIYYGVVHQAAGSFTLQTGAVNVQFPNAIGAPVTTLSPVDGYWYDYHYENIPPPPAQFDFYGLLDITTLPPASVANPIIQDIIYTATCDFALKIEWNNQYANLLCGSLGNITVKATRIA